MPALCKAYKPNKANPLLCHVGMVIAQGRFGMTAPGDALAECFVAERCPGGVCHEEKDQQILSRGLIVA